MENQDLSSEKKVNSLKLPFIFLIAAIVIVVLATIGLSIYQNEFSPKAKAIKKLQNIVNLLNTPDQKLITKYHVPSSEFEQQKAVLYCGYYNPATKSDKNCSSDSLAGIKDAITKGDYQGAQKTAKTLYPQFSNRTFGDTVVIIMSAAEAEKIDPQHKFLRFASDIPGAKPEFKDKANYTGSEIKRGAAYGMIELWYLLNNLK